MFIAILQLVTDDDDPYELVTRLMAAVPSGSFLVITHVAGDLGRQTPGAVEAARRLSELLPQRVNPRDDAQVTKFFDGLELVEPGVVPVQQWRPASDEEAAARANLWVGVTRKLRCAEALLGVRLEFKPLQAAWWLGLSGIVLWSAVRRSRKLNRAAFICSNA